MIVRIAGMRSEPEIGEMPAGAATCDAAGRLESDDGVAGGLS